MRLDENGLNQIIRTLPETNDVDLIKMTYEQPILLVFLRHFGCTFCKEALSDISNISNQIEKIGVKIVFVHMVDKETADLHLSFYQFQSNIHLGDPDKRLYQFFGLQKGHFRQLYGLSVMMRGFKAGVVDGHGHGWKAIGDMEQMPGLFMLSKGAIIRSYVHQLSSDRPDYMEFIEFALLTDK
jgi:thiol-disulfide isomerase/thioredoxin